MLHRNPDDPGRFQPIPRMSRRGRTTAHKAQILQSLRDGGNNSKWVARFLTSFSAVITIPPGGT
jgi:hypothetical protein